MIWTRLKSMKCPDCNSQLKEAVTVNFDRYICSKCGFMILKEGFNKLVEALYKKMPVRDFNDILGDLNNLGKNKMSLDFSDSPHLNK